MPRERTRTLAVGNSSPDFTLEFSHGEKVTMPEFRRGESPMLPIFFRDTW